MEDYKKRFLEEYNDLLKRACKLGTLLNEYEDNKLGFTPNCPYNLLAAQYHAMWSYLYILEQRAEIEKIKLK